MDVGILNPEMAECTSLHSGIFFVFFFLDFGNCCRVYRIILKEYDQR